MPGSFAALKKENNILKAQLSSMSDEVARLKELIQRHSGRSEEVLPSEEGAQCVEFLSKKYDDFHLFSGMAKDELQRLSTKLEELVRRCVNLSLSQNTACPPREPWPVRTISMVNRK